MKRYCFLGLLIAGIFQRFQGDVSQFERDALVRLIAERFEQHGPVRLLVAYDVLGPGMISAEDLNENMRFAKIASDKLAKMAAIGKHAWENTWIALFGLFGGIKAQHFDRSEIEKALAWLSE